MQPEGLLFDTGETLPEDVFLDIETSWERTITVIGFTAPSTGMVQLVAPDISAESLLDALPQHGRIFTFNGDMFDLPVIRKQLDVDLTDRFESWDLWKICRAAGIRGGQKKIEVELGISRESEGITGKDAMNLWRAWWEDTEREALDILLRYNAEDVLGMMRIVEFLKTWGKFKRVRKVPKLDT